MRLQTRGCCACVSFTFRARSPCRGKRARNASDYYFTRAPTESPPTVIVRHPKENPRKCSVLPLRGRDDLVFFTYPVAELPPLEGFVRLADEGPELSAADARRGLLLLDGSWNWARKMTRAFE